MSVSFFFSLYYIDIFCKDGIAGFTFLLAEKMFSVESHDSCPFCLDLSVMRMWKQFSWLGLQYWLRGMPFKQHVQEIGGQKEDDVGGLPRPLWLCCVGERVLGCWTEVCAQVGHPSEWTCSSFLFSIAVGSRQEHSSRMSQFMGNGITWVEEKDTVMSMWNCHFTTQKVVKTYKNKICIILNSLKTSSSYLFFSVMLLAWNISTEACR